MNLIQYFDATVFNFCNHTLACTWLDYVMVVITQFGNTLPLLVLGGVLLRDKFKRPLLADWLGAIIGLAVGSALLAALKYGLARPRPYRAAEYLGEPVRLVNEFLIKNSFPSGHTFTAFAAASIIAAFRPSLAAAGYLLAISVAFSRIYLGVHFPTDILAGSLMGIIFIWSGILIARKINKTKSC